MTPRNVELLAEYIRLHDAILAKNTQLLEEYNNSTARWTGGTPPQSLIAVTQQKLADYTFQMCAAGGFHEEWNRMLVYQLQVVMNEVKAREERIQHIADLRVLLTTNKEEFLRRMDVAASYGPARQTEYGDYQVLWQEYTAKQNRAKEEEERRLQVIRERERRIETEARRRIEAATFEEAVLAKMREMITPT